MAKGTTLAIGGVLLLGVVGVVCCYSTAVGMPQTAGLGEEKQFKAFAVKYGKDYKDQTELQFRFQQYRKTVDFIHTHNAKNSDFTLEVNEFADLTDEEFRSKYLTSFPANPSKKLKSASLPTANLPETIDWVAFGAVSPIQNQGSCGGCWAFASVGAIEGLHYIQNKTLYQLSPQQLIDCSSSFGNEGCNGGLMDDAFRYVMQAGGVEMEKDYPFKRYNGKCQADPGKYVAGISGYADVPVHNEMQLKAAVSQQPVAVGIQANQGNFMYYHSGVITSGCGANLDHAVLVVGYGEEAGTPYWLIKNTWGAHWGEKGFVKILRADANNATAGMCGIASMPSYPL